MAFPRKAGGRRNICMDTLFDTHITYTFTIPALTPVVKGFPMPDKDFLSKAVFAQSTWQMLCLHSICAAESAIDKRIQHTYNKDRKAVLLFRPTRSIICV